MKWALSIPLLDNQIYGQIRKKLIEALGGRFKEIIIGGAAMNPEVEEFFQKIKFPFTIGYGMTECGPLISYAPWNEFVRTSSGKILDIMEARIYKENPESETGEIQVRGENVMAGYYKNPKLPPKSSPKTDGCAPAIWERGTATAIYLSVEEAKL
jgi:long-chain acyl-CoA synthetase